MKLDLLDTPLRVTWNLESTDPRPTNEQMVTIARRLVRGGVFYLTLEGRPAAHPAIASILRELADDGPRISLVFSGSETERRGLPEGLPLQRLWLDASGHVGANDTIDEESLGADVDFLRRKGYEPSLILVPSRGNLDLLPELITSCRRLGMGTFKLPNVPIDGSFSTAPAHLPRPEDLDRLASSLPDAPSTAWRGVKLEVHDRFLWEILSPGIDGELSEYGGCQAANSLAHVDPMGRVHPCSSWPRLLGNLLGEELEEIWAAPARLEVRREIAEVPAGCRSCRDYGLCFGACRGLGRTWNRQQGDRDPSCGGPR